MTLKKLKAKWKVQEAPTGRYRAFYRRGWPQLLTDKGEGHLLASIKCDTDYVPMWVRDGTHEELTVFLYNYSKGPVHRTCHCLKARFARLEEAKAAVDAFYAKHPDWLPKD